jgi:hypothetical protein
MSSYHPLRQRFAGRVGQLFGDEVARRHDLATDTSSTLRLPQIDRLEHAVDYAPITPQDQGVASDFVAVLAALAVMLQVDACAGTVVFGGAVDGG